MPASTSILLLRHGQSTWNAEHRWQGRADPPLSEVGRAETELACAAISRGAVTGLVKVSAIVASDLRRASETAALLTERLEWGEVRFEPDLRERDVGVLTGLTRDEIEDRWPGLLSAMRAGQLDPEGAEPMPVLTERATRAIGRIARDHPGGTVVVVTHGALIRAVENDVGVATAGPPPNLGGRWVTVLDRTIRAGAVITLR
jgi:broad specificity phosphatase PhoE